MSKEFTDEQVEIEIERLLNSEAVKLAKVEMRLKYRRRQYMYQLRHFEKRGEELIAQGIDETGLREKYAVGDDVDD